MPVADGLVVRIELDENGYCLKSKWRFLGRYIVVNIAILMDALFTLRPAW